MAPSGGCSASCGQNDPGSLVVVAVAFLSTAGQVFGPKILGNGINQLMDGLVGKGSASTCRPGRRTPRPSRS